MAVLLAWLSVDLPKFLPKHLSAAQHVLQYIIVESLRLPIYSVYQLPSPPYPKQVSSFNQSRLEIAVVKLASTASEPYQRQLRKRSTPVMGLASNANVLGTASQRTLTVLESGCYSSRGRDP